jgi:hypothetical protein
MRFRIAGSTYSFEEGGQVKVTLNIQTVGSTDLLHLGPKGDVQGAKEFHRLIRKLNERLVELRSRGTAPSMADYDFLAAFQDPASALAASRDKNVLAKARKLLEKASTDSAIESTLLELLGSIGKDSEQAAANSATDKFQDELAAQYKTIIDGIPTYDQDTEFGILTDAQFSNMHDNTFYAMSDGVTSQPITPAQGKSSGVSNTEKNNKKSDFLSYGSVFMNLIAKPMQDSGQYDEVQVIFYPFNRYAGVVHDLPISSFPIEKTRLEKAMEELARSTPSISCRQIIGTLYDRFVHFSPSRAYLMAGFYNQTLADKGQIDQYDPKVVKKVAFKINGKDVKKDVAPSVQATFEARLKLVGITEARFQLPVVQVYVEGAPLTDAAGAPMLDERGNPKSIVKIHVYDASMDPHSTLSDIIRAAKDNELGIVTLPVAKWNAAQRASPGVPLDTASPEFAKVREVIEAGEKAGILKAISLDDLKPTNDIVKNTIEDMKSGNIFYRVAGDYDQIKQLVTAGIPVITYGSSLTAITNASLSSNTSAGLGNVQLLRAFAEPGEARTESLTSGVPMQIVPAQLSISTIGCTLFSPMQRMFIDFGTGTSIDSVYHVLSFDSTIGKDGFKTEVKLGYADSFAAYRSLNQNLALLAVNMKGDTTKAPAVSPTFTGTPAVANTLNSNVPDIDPNRIVSGLKKTIRQALVAAAMPLAQLEANEKAKIQKKLQVAVDAVNAKIEQEKQKAVAKVEAYAPEVTKAVQDAQRKVSDAAAEAQAKVEPAIRAALLTKSIVDIILLADGLPADIRDVLLAEVLAAVDEARKQAAENARV